MLKYIVGSYTIMGGYITAANKSNYRPKNELMACLWELPNIKTDYGRTVTAVILSAAPMMVPVIVFTVPMLYLYDRKESFNKH